MNGEQAKLTIKAVLTYDAENMHCGDRDPEARDWFIFDVLHGGGLVLHDNKEIGDAIGTLSQVELGERDDAAELRAADNGLRNAVTAFVDKHFHGGSKANRPDYWVAGVTTADVYALREALYAARGTTPLQDHKLIADLRDEAAELRAELLDIANRIDRLAANQHLLAYPRPSWDTIIERLRHLAGGEEQE